MRIYSARESNGSANRNNGVAKRRTKGVKNKLGRRMK